jgi:hypothetical protein
MRPNREYLLAPLCYHGCVVWGSMKGKYGFSPWLRSAARKMRNYCLPITSRYILLSKSLTQWISCSYHPIQTQTCCLAERIQSKGNSNL